jgi:hypothetical protein
LHGQRASPERIVRVIACLAAGLDIRGTARVFAAAPKTGLQWLVEAAEPLQACSTYFLHDLHRNQVQLDALDAVRSAGRDGEVRAAAAIAPLSTAPLWGWTAIEPESKVMVDAQGGDRGLAMAQAVLHPMAQLVAPGCVPRFLSDGHPHALPTIVSHVGHWGQPPRRPSKGAAPTPRWMPVPEILDAHVIQTMRRWRLVEVTRHVVLGTKAAVDQVVSACGWQSNTADVARRTLSLRQRVSALRRRSAPSCQSQKGL